MKGVAKACKILIFKRLILSFEDDEILDNDKLCKFNTFSSISSILF